MRAWALTLVLTLGCHASELREPIGAPAKTKHVDGTLITLEPATAAQALGPDYCVSKGAYWAPSPALVAKVYAITDYNRRYIGGTGDEGRRVCVSAATVEATTRSPGFDWRRQPFSDDVRLDGTFAAEFDEAKDAFVLTPATEQGAGGAAAGTSTPAMVFANSAIAPSARA